MAHPLRYLAAFATVYTLWSYWKYRRESRSVSTTNSSALTKQSAGFETTIEQLAESAAPTALLEEHLVETTDGYLLTLFRLRPVKIDPHKPPVVLQHGLMESCAIYLLNGRTSLAAVLANAGYDVWLANNRGNSYSLRHVRYKRSDERYWQFTLDDFARYDVPAIVRYVLSRTDRPELAWIGHSQGAAQLLAAISIDPSLCEQIATFISLGGTVTLHPATPFLRFAALIGAFPRVFFAVFRRRAFLPFMFKIRQWLHGPLNVVLMTALCRLIFGWSTRPWLQDRLGHYFYHFPDMTATATVMRWLQSANHEYPIEGASKHSHAHTHKKHRPFKYYDHGRHRNKLYYEGSEVPPTYVKPKKWPRRVVLFIGGKDGIVDMHSLKAWKNSDNTDSKAAADAVTKVVEESDQTGAMVVTEDIETGWGEWMVVYLKEYDHMDFVWAADADQVVNARILKILAENHPPPHSAETTVQFRSSL